MRPSIAHALATAVIVLTIGSSGTAFFVIEKAMVKEARLHESKLAEAKLEAVRHGIEIWIRARIQALQRQAAYPALLHAAMHPQTGLSSVRPVLEDANGSEEGVGTRILDFSGELIASHGRLTVPNRNATEEIQGILNGEVPFDARLIEGSTSSRLVLVVPILRFANDPNSVEGALVSELPASLLARAVATWQFSQHGWIELHSPSRSLATYGSPQATQPRSVGIGNTGIGVRFAHDPTATNQIVASTRTRLVVIFAVFALGGAMAVWLIARMTIRNPIDKLLAGMERARSGERNVRISEQQRFSEPYLLARDYNRLISSLENAHAELNQANVGLEDRIRRRTSELEQRNAELNDFAHVASHDLQEPLRKVTMFCEMAMERSQEVLDEDSLTYMEHAIRGAHRMRALIQDLLNYAQVGADFAHDQLVPVVDCLIEVTENLQSQIDASGAEVSWDELPVVRHQKLLVVQLLQNLVGNAIKYRSADAPRVHVSASLVESNWHFRVQDNGKGIERQYHDRVFQVFQRLEGRGDTEGTGVGLALCRKIVERRGGHISILEGIEGGSTFEFTVPVEPPETVAEA